MSKFFKNILRWTEEVQKSKDRRNILILFAVKPVLVIYMMSYVVTASVGTQLWLYKTCKVYFKHTGRIYRYLDILYSNIFTVLYLNNFTRR